MFVVALFLLGLLLRLLLILPDRSFDAHIYIAWGTELLNHGFSGFYARDIADKYPAAVNPNYPPLTMMLFYITTSIHKSLFDLAWYLNTSFPQFPSGIVTFLESQPVVLGFPKFPAIFFELGLAYVVYLFSKKRLLAAALVLFNPAFFYNSALWGQLEAAPLFFLTLSFYLLLFTKHTYWSTVSIVCALLTKQTAVIFIPIYAIVFLKKYSLKEFITSSSIGAILFFVSFLPFYKSGSILLFPFITYIQKILLASGLTFASNHAFNFWALITQWTDIQDTKIFLFGMSYRLWGYALTSLFILPALYLLWKRKLTTENVLYVCVIVSFAAFMFLTKIHERHFAQVLPFLLILAVKDKTVMKIFLALCIFHVANMYHNWPVPGSDVLISIIRSPIVVNGSIVAMLGAFCYLLYFKLWSNNHSPQKK